MIIFHFRFSQVVQDFFEYRHYLFVFSSCRIYKNMLHDGSGLQSLALKHLSVMGKVALS